MAEEAAQVPMTILEQRREELRERFTQLQWDLGGAAYEMAARDYFRLDVLAKMAARLQLVDAELAEIERMARLEHAGASGSCPGCGSLYARGAVYCWRCGRSLHETTQAVVSSHLTDPGQFQAGGNGHVPPADPVVDDVYLGTDPGAVAGTAGFEPSPGIPDPEIPGPEARPDVGWPPRPDSTNPPPWSGDGEIDLDPGPGNHPNIDPGTESGTNRT